MRAPRFGKGIFFSCLEKKVDSAQLPTLAFHAQPTDSLGASHAVVHGLHVARQRRHVRIHDVALQESHE